MPDESSITGSTTAPFSSTTKLSFTHPSLPFRAALVGNLGGTRSIGLAGIILSTNSTLDDESGCAIKPHENNDKTSTDNFILHP